MLPETITKLKTIKPETAKLEARKEIRKNLIRYLARCSIEHLKRKTLIKRHGVCGVFCRGPRVVLCFSRPLREAALLLTAASGAFPEKFGKLCLF